MPSTPMQVAILRSNKTMAYIASIGFFDGVHLGHLSLVQQLQAKAQTLDQDTMLITFTHHPLTQIQGHSPQLLLTHDERLARLETLGIDRIIELDFPSVYRLTAKAFMNLLHEQYQVDALLMGYDHHFGSDRLCEIEDYQAAGQQVGVQVYLAQQADAGAISSTLIRHRLREGNIADANRFLGYAYTLTGTVVHGQHIGTSIGFPTANLAIPAAKLIPQAGVYAAKVNQRKALVNIGHNPTFGEHQPLSVEVHIPDFCGDLYGQTLSVELLRYLRADQHYPTPQDLINQIHRDIKQL